MRSPTANAFAPISLHICAAAPSVCTRIVLKSAPKRGSIKARTSEGKGLPPLKELAIRFWRSRLTVLLSWGARCTTFVVVAELGLSAIGLIAASGIAITLAAIKSASCSYLSPGVLTVSFA